MKKKPVGYKMRNAGGTAFPASFMWEREAGHVSKTHCPGMSLRDYFASQALVGILNGSVVLATRGTGMSAREMAIDVYKMADAMLKERENDPR